MRERGLQHVVKLASNEGPWGPLPAAAAAIVKKANEKKVPVISYDRLILNADVDYYVSFDNVAVGTAIGSGLVKCLNDAGVTEGPIALLDGSPTDNNATLFAQGYKAAIEAAAHARLVDPVVGGEAEAMDPMAEAGEVTVEEVGGVRGWIRSRRVHGGHRSA